MKTKISAVLAALILSAVLCFSHTALGAVFNPADEDEFRNALQSSETNGEDNTIFLPEAILDTEGDPFTFNPSDTGTMTIVGAGPELTIIDAGGNGRGLSIDTSNLPDDSDADVTVNDLTIRNGSDAFGANLFVLTSSADIIVLSNAFENGSANFGGGARAFTASGNIDVRGNDFMGNSAFFGGGIDCVVTTTGTILVGSNNFTGNTGGNGGGLFAQVSNGTIDVGGNSFINNRAVDGGGAFISTTGEVVTDVIENTFEENFAENQGGGLNMTETGPGMATVENNMFQDNSCGDRGGGAFIFTDDDETVLRDNSFISNSADVNGGGLSLFLKSQSASATLNGNTFATNTAVTGFGSDISLNDDVELNSIGSFVFLTDNTFSGFFSYCENIPSCVPDINGDVLLSENAGSSESGTNAQGLVVAAGGCALIASELDGNLIWINLLLLFIPALLVAALYIRRRKLVSKGRSDRTKLFIAPIITLVLFGFSESPIAAEFNVSTPGELREALATSETNGQDDTIFVAAGVYETDGVSFSYNPAEDNTLTIIGAGSAVTIIDAEDIGQGLRINTVASLPTTAQPPLTDDGADILVSGLTVRNGNSTFLGAAEVRTDKADVTFENCAFSNSSAEFGAGLDIATDSGDISVSGSSFTDNSATFGGGMAINTSTGLVFIFKNNYSGNRASDGAAGRINNADGVTRLDSNFVQDNQADNRGGGFRLNINTGNLIAVNNVFAENSANSGGAMNVNCVSGNLTFTSNTMTENTAVDTGGALSLFVSDDASETNIYNNIFWLNNIILGNGVDVFMNDDVNANNAGSEVNVFNNDISDLFSLCEQVQGCAPDVSVGANINEDPDFVNPAALDFRLQRGSPAIDAGDLGAPSLPVTDFDGNPRISGGGTDMGAFEFLRSGGGGGGSCSIAGESDTEGFISIYSLMIILFIVISIRSCARRYLNKS